MILLQRRHGYRQCIAFPPMIGSKYIHSLCLVSKLYLDTRQIVLHLYQAYMCILWLFSCVLLIGQQDIGTSFCWIVVQSTNTPTNTDNDEPPDDTTTIPNGTNPEDDDDDSYLCTWICADKHSASTQLSKMATRKTSTTKYELCFQIRAMFPKYSFLTLQTDVLAFTLLLLFLVTPYNNNDTRDYTVGFSLYKTPAYITKNV